MAKKLEEQKNQTAVDTQEATNPPQLVELLSSAVKRHGKSLGPLVFKQYADLVSKIYSHPNPTEEHKTFVKDYLATIVKLENEKARLSDGELARELSRLPDTGKDTIKLHELVTKPETFDGEKPRPRRWLQEYNEAIVANGWTDKLAIKYLPTFLSKSAKDWYWTEIRPYMNDQLKWLHVMDAFSRNYMGDADLEQLSQAVDNTRQRQGESVCNFIPRYRRLLMLLSSTIPEDEQIRQIKSRLRPEYKPLLALSDPKTLAGLKDICLKIEAEFISSKNDQEKHNARNKNNYSKDKQSKRDEGESSQRGYQRKTSSRSPRGPTRKTDKETLKCSRCDRNNHLAKDCFSKTKLSGEALPHNTAHGRSSNINTVNELNEQGKVLCIRHAPVSKQRLTPNPTNLVVGGGGKLIAQNVTINGLSLNAVVDTGAFVSVIDDSLLESQNWTLNTPVPPLVGADGNRLQARGMTELSFEIRLGMTTKKVIHQFAVVKNLTTQMLLGLELMNKLEIIIDTSSSRLCFKSKPKSGVRLREDINLPARSQSIISTELNAVGTVLVAPFFFNDRVHIANSIAHADDCRSPALLLNWSDEPIKLSKGTQIASYEQLNEDDNCDQTLVVNNVETRPIRLERSKACISIGSQLDVDQAEQLKVLIHDHADAFSLNGEIGCTEVHKHKIELLPETQPYAEPLRRRALIQVEETRRQVQKLLEEDIIEESSSPWASAYVLARKKNGEYRLCIDFRRLNLATKKTVYPLPNVEDCLETLSGKNYFTQLDFSSGFWQIAMSPESKEATAFRTEDGLFQFKRMPFGLTNAPASFQKTINTVLAGVKGINMQVFMDDVCVATSTWPEHLALLKRVFMLVIEANLKLKPEKCVFAAPKITFLGHEISKDGIRQDPDKLKALTRLPVPTDTAGVRRALGMFSYYRKFVQNFAMLAEPLTKLTKKGAEFKWEQDQQNAYSSIIKKLEENATLANFNHSDPVLIKTDASKKGIAGMLLQKQRGDFKLVTCCSRRLTASESNYGITDLEGLAMVYTLTKLRPYLLGKHFKILVDHCALCALNKNMPNSARLRRWAITLSEYDFEIVYTKGKLHEDIDCLSRAPVDNCPDQYLENCVYSIVTPLDSLSWRGAYSDAESREFYQQAFENENGFKLINEIIYKADKLFVPVSLRDEIVRLTHTSSMNAHPGMNATVAKLKENYFWPKMAEDVSRIINLCSTCLAQKPERVQQRGQMHSFQIYRPGEQIAIDLIEKLVESHNGNQFIIVAIDMFTRFVEAKAVPDKGAPTFTQFMVEYCGRYGVPHSILTDGSTTLCNAFTNEVLKVFGAEHCKSTPYHSQGNAVVERVNQTIEEKLRLVLDDPLNDRNWDAALPVAILAINTSYHSSIGCSPYELTFGEKPPLQDKKLTIKANPQDLYARLIKAQLKECYSNAIAIQSANQERSKKYFEAKRQDALFESTDLVYVRAPKRSSRLARKYSGPYKIVSREKDIYSLETMDGSKRTTRHVSDLRPAKQRQPETASINVIMMVINLLVMLTTIANADILFEKVKPIVWMQTKSIVSPGSAEYDINFAYSSPCPLFERNIKSSLLPGQELSSDDKSNLEAFTSSCKALYVMEWLHEVKQLLEVKVPNKWFDGEKAKKAYKENKKREIAKRDVSFNEYNSTEKYNHLPQMTPSRLLVWYTVGPFMNLLLGPSARESALQARLNRLVEIRNEIANMSTTELYIRRVAHEGRLAKRDYQSIATKVSIPTDYKVKEIIGMILCPICIPWIYENVVERTLKEKIERVKDELNEKLGKSNTAYLIDTISQDGALTQYEHEKAQENATLRRDRRGIFDTVASELVNQAIGVFTGNIVSNLVSFAIEYINPNSNTNRLGRLESAYTDMRKSFDIQRQIDRGILDNIDKLSNIVQETVKRMNQNVRSFPQYTWLSSLIVNKITQSGLDLQRVADEARKGKLAVEPFARLTGITGLRNFNTENTFLVSITKINDYALNFKFSAILESPDTKAYRAYGFSHWDNLDETPRLLQYSGAQYLIYNETSNCIKSVTGALDEYVSDQCIELDGEDPALNQWNTLESTNEIERFANASQVKKTLRYNYIYCFPGSITIEGKTYKCPFEVFRLKTSREFKTARQRHVPTRMSFNTSQVEIAVDTVHAGHFKEDSDVIQHLALFDQLRLERRRIKNMTESYEGSFVLNKSNPYVWFGIGTWLANSAGTIIYVLWIVYKRFSATKSGPTAPMRIVYQPQEPLSRFKAEPIIEGSPFLSQY